MLLQQKRMHSCAVTPWQPSEWLTLSHAIALLYQRGWCAAANGPDALILLCPFML